MSTTDILTAKSNRVGILNGNSAVTYDCMNQQHSSLNHDPNELIENLPKPFCSVQLKLITKGSSFENKHRAVEDCLLLRLRNAQEFIIFKEDHQDGYIILWIGSTNEQLIYQADRTGLIKRNVYGGTSPFHSSRWKLFNISQTLNGTAAQRCSPIFTPYEVGLLTLYGLFEIPCPKDIPEYSSLKSCSLLEFSIALDIIEQCNIITTFPSYIMFQQLIQNLKPQQPMSLFRYLSLSQRQTINTLTDILGPYLGNSVLLDLYIRRFSIGFILFRLIMLFISHYILDFPLIHAECITNFLMFLWLILLRIMFPIFISKTKNTLFTIKNRPSSLLLHQYNNTSDQSWPIQQVACMTLLSDLINKERSNDILKIVNTHTSLKTFLLKSDLSIIIQQQHTTNNNNCRFPDSIDTNKSYTRLARAILYTFLMMACVTCVHISCQFGILAYNVFIVKENNFYWSSNLFNFFFLSLRLLGSILIFFTYFIRFSHSFPLYSAGVLSFCFGHKTTFVFIQKLILQNEKLTLCFLRTDSMTKHYVTLILLFGFTTIWWNQQRVLRNKRHLSSVSQSLRLTTLFHILAISMPLFGSLQLDILFCLCMLVYLIITSTNPCSTVLLSTQHFNNTTKSTTEEESSSKKSLFYVIPFHISIANNGNVLKQNATSDILATCILSACCILINYFISYTTSSTQLFIGILPLLLISATALCYMMSPNLFAYTPYEVVYYCCHTVFAQHLQSMFSFLQSLKKEVLKPEKMLELGTSSSLDTEDIKKDIKPEHCEHKTKKYNMKIKTIPKPEIITTHQPYQNNITTLPLYITQDDDPFPFLNRFIGTWKLLKQRSDPMEEVSKALGVNWIIRRAIEQFTPSCIYFREEPLSLRITTLLPLNNIRAVTLKLSGQPYNESDGDVGDWTSTTNVVSEKETLVTERIRNDDRLVVVETRQLISKDYPHFTQKRSSLSASSLFDDVLWYLAEVKQTVTGDVIASSNRYYKRTEAPPPYVAFPVTTMSSYPRITDSVAGSCTEPYKPHNILTSDHNLERSSRSRTSSLSSLSDDDKKTFPIRLIESLDDLPELTPYDTSEEADRLFTKRPSLNLHNLRKAATIEQTTTITRQCIRRCFEIDVPHSSSRHEAISRSDSDHQPSLHSSRTLQQCLHLSQSPTPFSKKMSFENHKHPSHQTLDSDQYLVTMPRILGSSDREHISDNVTSIFRTKPQLCPGFYILEKKGIHAKRLFAYIALSQECAQQVQDLSNTEPLDISSISNFIHHVVKLSDRTKSSTSAVDTKSLLSLPQWRTYTGGSPTVEFLDSQGGFPSAGRSSTSLPLSSDAVPLLLDLLFDVKWLAQADPCIDKAFPLYELTPNTIIAYIAHKGRYGISGRDYIVLVSRIYDSDKNRGTIGIVSIEDPRINSSADHTQHFALNTVRGIVHRCGFDIQVIPNKVTERRVSEGLCITYINQSDLRLLGGTPSWLSNYLRADQFKSLTAIKSALLQDYYRKSKQSTISSADT